MKNILVPVDFSECSANATVLAGNLARKTGSTIHLLHVVEIGETDSSLGSTGSWAGAEDVVTVPYMMERLKQIKGQMHKFIADNNLSDVTVHDFIETGEPYLKINEGAEKVSADMIVMGTHGLSGASRIFIGSVASKVVQHANRPVISIKERAETGPSNIVFASDFTKEAQRVFEAVKSFAEIFSSKINLLKVIDSGDADKKEEALNDLHAFASAQSAGNIPCHVVTASNTEEGILLFSKREKIDLISIGTHGRGGLSRFFNPSISAELVNHAFCPVLTVNFRD